MLKIAYRLEKLLANYIGSKVIVMIIVTILFSISIYGQTYVNRSLAQNTNASSLNISVPTGTSVGDFLLVVFHSDYTGPPSDISFSSDWILLDEGVAAVNMGTSSVYYKKVLISDPNSYVFNFPSGVDAFAQMVRYSGVDILPIGSHSHNSPPSAPFNIAPATSTFYMPTKIIRILRGNGAGTFQSNNMPTGYSLVGTYNAHGKSITMIDAPITTVGNQDTLTVPHSVTNTAYRNSSIIIRGVATTTTTTTTIIINLIGPMQGNEYISTDEDTSTDVNILLNNIDLDGDIVSLNALTTATSQGGTISYNMVDSIMTYLPSANFNGIDTAFYTVCDDATPIRCVEDSIFINVQPVNDPPSQGNEYISLVPDASTTVNILANNIDPDGDLIWVTGALIRRPSQNFFAYNVSDGTLTYTASSSFTGVDSLFYTVRDGLGETVLDTVLVNICGSGTDCDGDGVSDTQEASDGTDPSDPCDYQGIVLASSLTEIFCEGDTFLFHDQPLTRSGFYKDTLSNVSGCDSIVSLTLILQLSERKTLNETICNGDSYLFNGTVYNTSGIYVQNLAGLTGCDTILTLNLTVEDIVPISTSGLAICEGTAVFFNNQSLTTSGIYRDTLSNVSGCDSTVILNLTVHPIKGTIVNVEICDDTSYDFNGTSYNTTGSYTANLLTSAGCDSIVTLNLTVDPTVSTTITETICDDIGYVFNGTNYNTTGSYTANLSTTEGCDSIVTLNLRVHPAKSTTLNETICDDGIYSFNGTNYNTTGSYTANLSTTEGCDSIVTLNLRVYPTKSTTLNETICDDGIYSFNGTNYNTTGSYTANLSTTEGCDSIVTLNLTVHPTKSTTLNETICDDGIYSFNGTTYNTTGSYTANLSTTEGCDSIVTLNLTVHPTKSTTLNETICDDGIYSFNGTNYNTTGSYTANLSTTEGCDSIVTLNLTVHPTKSTTLNETICDDGIYSFNGTTYNTTGIYTANFLTSAGCDSTVILNLTVHPTSTTTLTEAVCNDVGYLFDGTVYNTTGIYTANFLTSAGCDSTVILNLTVHPTSTTTLTEAVCNDVGYLFDGIVYNTTGIYTANFLTSAGCDSTVILNLTVHPTSTTTLTEAVCNGVGYEFDGIVYNTTGIYTATYLTSAGCDSTVTLNLTVHSIISSTLNESICQGEEYLLDEVAYSSAGTYAITILNVNGCDSTIVLNLVVGQNYTSTINQNICEGSSYTFNNKVYSATGIYQDTLLSNIDCDSIFTLNIVSLPNVNTTILDTICQGSSYLFNGINYTTAGTYTSQLLNSVGCDSTVTLDLALIPCVDLELSKDLADSQSDTVRLGETIHYEICVINTNITPGYNIGLTDHLPQGMALDPNSIGWTLEPDNKAIYTIPGPLTMGQQICIPIQLNLLDPSTQTINNYAEISGVTDETGVFIADFDSTPGGDLLDDEEDDIDFVPIIFNPCPSVIVGSVSIDICKGDTIQLEGFGGSVNATYQWTGSGYLSCTDCPKPFVSPDSTTTYSLTIQEITGCSASNFSRIIVHSPPAIDLGPDKNICSGTAINLNAEVGATNYQWTASDGSIVDNIANPSVMPSGLVNYCVTITDAFSCTNADCITVNVAQELHTTLDEQICDGSFYDFNGEQLIIAGVYVDTLTSITGCDSVVTLNLSTMPCVDLALQKDLAPEQSDTVRLGDRISYEICIINEGISPAYNILITDHIPQGMFLDLDNIGWTISDNGDAIYTILGPLVGGEQECIPIFLNLLDPSTQTINNYAEISGVTDETGVFIADFDSSTSDENTDEFEDDIDFVPIVFNPCPSVIVGSLDINICKGDIIQLEGFGGSPNATYQWEGGEDLSCTDCPKPFVSPDTTSIYLLTIKEITGCKASNYSKIIVHSPPSLDLGADKNICGGTTINLDANTTAVSYEWTASDSSVIASIASPSISPSSTTNYCLTITDEYGCVATDCIMVFVKESFTTYLEEQICDGGFYLLNGKQFTTIGTYTEIFQSSTGCDSVVILTINEVVPCVDLSLEKDLAVDQSDTVRIGETIHYEICIKNEGISPAYNIEITDHIPAGLNLSANNTGWTLLADNDAVYTIDGPLTTGETVCVPIFLDLRDPSEGFINNYAEISGVTDERGVFIADFDSSPNNNSSEEEEEFEDDIDFETIYFDPCPFVLVAGQRLTICEGDSIELEALGGSDLATYEWGRQNELSCYDCGNPIASPEETTVYVLTINEITGCSVSTTVTVNVQRNPSIDIGGDQFVCLGTTTTLSTDPVGNIEWTLSDGAFLSNESTLRINPRATTTYCANTIGEDGCTDSDCATIFVGETITTNINEQICEGTSFNFNGQFLTENGQYTTTLIGEAGCDSTVLLDLAIFPLIRTERIDTICIGTSYTFNNEILTEAGTYTTTYTASGGCDSISVLKLVTENCADLSLHTRLSAGQQATFAIGDTVNYEIIVLNEGTVPMHSIQIVSRLPEGISPLREGNEGWTLSRSATFIISEPLLPGKENSINLRLRIEPTTKGFLTKDILTEITAMYYEDGTLAQDIDSSISSTDEPDRPLEDDESIITLNILSCTDFTVSAGAYQRVCQGETVLLEATGGVSYQWSPSVSLSQYTIFNPLATPLETTMYTVTATDRNGCTATDQVQVVVENCNTPPPCKVVAFANPDKTICKDEFAQLIVSGGVSWEWSPRESLTSYNSDIPVAAPTITTQYTVTVTDENGCTATDKVVVFVEDCATPPACEAVAFACPDKTICKGRSAQLVVSGGVNWEWSPKESLTNFNSDIPVASPTVTTDYTVTVTDHNGCTVEEYVTVFVNDCRRNIADTEEYILIQPKVFLQGAMLPNENLMHDQLREKNLIPFEEPYTQLIGYENIKPIFQAIGSGEEIISPTVLETTGPDAIVDWVFLELRWEYDPSKVIRTRSVLIQRDGDIVDVDGYSPVRFNIPTDNYYLAIRHRNHLGVMTQEPISLKRNRLYTIDFTPIDAACYTLKDSYQSSQYPMIQIEDRQCLWGGNSNGDNKLIFQGPELDQEQLFFDIALHPDNISADGFPNYNFILKGYLQGDNNMDGELRYQGPNNDIDALQFFNILQHKENERFLTNKIIYEQLPRK